MNAPRFFLSCLATSIGVLTIASVSAGLEAVPRLSVLLQGNERVELFGQAHQVVEKAMLKKLGYPDMMDYHQDTMTLTNQERFDRYAKNFALNEPHLASFWRLEGGGSEGGTQSLDLASNERLVREWYLASMAAFSRQLSDDIGDASLSPLFARYAFENASAYLSGASTSNAHEQALDRLLASVSEKERSALVDANFFLSIKRVEMLMVAEEGGEKPKKFSEFWAAVKGLLESGISSSEKSFVEHYSRRADELRQDPRVKETLNPLYENFSKFRNLSQEPQQATASKIVFHAKDDNAVRGYKPESFTLKTKKEPSVSPKF
jgi:hypothetical protein